MLAITVGGRRLVSSVQATWNLLEPSAGPALQAAHAAGVRVVVKEAVANGRLVGAAVAPELAAVADRHDVGVDAVAIGAALARPWCDVVLSGAVTPDQLTSNAAAVTVAPSELDTLAGLAEPPDAYWSARSRRPWT